jgi:O-antigen/teichoic acid export membrane protein
VGPESVTEAPDPASAAAAVARRAGRGAFALGIRQVVVHGLNLTAGILLARLLSPAEFGIYAVIMLIVGFLVAFGDVGLGASLIRQREEPVTEDFRAVFTIQQLLVLAAVIGLWFLAPGIAEAYGRPPEEAVVFRMVGLALLVTSLQTIAVVRLERNLAFDRLAVVEVSQAVVFNSLAVTLAWLGWGVTSFAVALLARAVTGAVLANLVSPWPIGWRWDPARVRSHLAFGVPYQGITFVSLFKDSITPILIGLWVGITEVGYVNWALMVAAYPVLALMALQRIYLPAFSRMQEYGPEFQRFIERVLRLTNALVAPLAILMLVLIEPTTRIVFGEKWLPALPYFYLLWAANLFVPTATPVMALLNALGDSRMAFRFAVLWMAGTWLLGAPLILTLGALGFALANLVVQFSNLWLYRVVQSRTSFRIIAPVLPVWGAACAAGGALLVLTQWLPPSTLVELLGCALAGGLVYLVSLFVVDPAGMGRVLGWLRRDAWSLASR